MKLFLSLLLLFNFSLVGWSQSVSVYPFQDYENCRTGFLDQFGDTIWNAVFDSYFYIDGGRPSIAVEKAGKFGVLNYEGKVVLDFEMDSIVQLSYGRYLAAKNGKFGVLSDDATLLTDIIYSEIVESPELSDVSKEFQFYTVRIDDKYGFLDANFKERVPVKYEYCSFYPMYFYNEGHHFYDFQYFIVRSKGLVGVLDFQGNELLAPSFPEVYAVYPDIKCTSSDHYFKVKNEDEKWALLDKNFDTIVPFYEKLDLLYPNYLDSCESTSPYVVYGHAPHHSRAYNVKKGTFSSKYRRVAPFENFSLFRDFRGELGWGVLDENFIEIYTQSRYEPSYLSTIGYGIPQNDFVNFVEGSPLYGGQGHPYWKPRLYPSDSVIWIFTSNDDYEFGRPHHPSMTKVGLVNFYTESQISPDYERIYLLKKDGLPYYWAIKVIDSMWSISVFDREFRNVKQFEGVKMYPNYEDDIVPLTIYYEGDSSLVQLENREGKKGLFQADGSTVLPLNYQQIEPFVWSMPLNNFGASRDNLWEVFNREGIRMFPEPYKSIQQRNDFWLVHGLNESFLMDQNFEHVLDNVTYQTVIYRVDENGKTKGKSSGMSNGYVSKGKLYVHENSEFVLYDKKRLNIDEDIFIFQGKFLMNKKGRVLNSPSYHGELTKNNEGFLFNELNQLSYFDEKGKLVNKIRFDRIEYLVDIGQVHRNDSTGILNVKTGEWIIPPGSYAEIAPIKEGRTVSAYWVRKVPGALKYDLIFRNEKFASDVQTDTPFDHFYQGLMIINNGDKYGLVSNEGKLLLPFEMDEVRQYESFVLYKSNGKWRVLSINLTSNNELEYLPLNEDFDHFYCQDMRSKHIFALRSDSIAVLSTSLQEIIPFSPVETILRDSSYILSRIALYQGQLPSHRQLSKEDVYVNNRLFFENLQFDLVSNDSAKKLNLPFNNWYLQRGFEYIKHSSVSEVSVKSRKLESSFDSQFYSIVDETTYYRKEWVSFKEAETDLEYGVYRMEDGNLLRFDPSNLFANPNHYHSVIDAFLTDEIQVTQRYGSACLDLPQKISELKDNVIIDKYGLMFNDSLIHLRQISISWELLQPYLAEEYKNLPFD